jgi:hypothetical protein
VSNINYIPLVRYPGYIGENDCGCGPQDSCHKCFEWRDEKQFAPELVLDWRGVFWICPKCGVSYGADAKKGLPQC